MGRVGLPGIHGERLQRLASPTVKGIPAAVLELDPGGAVAVGQEPDLDLGGVAGVSEDVPEVDKASGRLPHQDRPPVDLVSVGIPLEDAATGPWFEDEAGALAFRRRV